jgi:hypothetical protein
VSSLVVLAGCSWVPGLGDADGSVEIGVAQDVFEELRVGQGLGCRILLDELQLVASAADPAGGPDYGIWTAPTEGGGEYRVETQLSDDGEIPSSLSSGGSCEREPKPSIDFGGGSATGEWVNYSGRVHVDAAEVVLQFADLPALAIPLSEGGWFIDVRAGRFGEPPPMPMTVTAIDQNGRTVASLDF